MAAKNTQELSISGVRVGMCVIKMDISWFESPFFTQTRVIKDEQDIRALKDAGVKHVTIDLDRSVVQASEVQPPKIQAPEAQEPERPLDIEQPEIKTEQSNKPIELAEEMHAAKELRAELTRKVEDLQDDIEHGKPIDAEPLVPLIDDTVRSLARNNQALMSLVHLSRKSKKIADHAFGSFCLVLDLAMALKVPVEEREQLGVAALLHEVGWTQLPLNLMGKRKAYTEIEKQLVVKHVDIAASLLAQNALPALTQRFIAEHHERMDGTGYPKGLEADQLHPLSHLLMVVDIYEEAVHQLSDQPGQIPTAALRMLYKQAEQGRFETKVVAAFISNLGIYPPTTAVLLNTGEKALVIEVHAQTPLMPKIRILYDRQGQALVPGMEIDLRHQNEADSTRQITKALDPSSAEIDPKQCLVVNE